MPFRIGEQRYTSAGNIYVLESWDGRNRCGVRRIGIVNDERPTNELWDYDVTYCWDVCQWESLPLIGEQSEEPSFGIFAPQAAI